MPGYAGGSERGGRSWGNRTSLTQLATLLILLSQLSQISERKMIFLFINESTKQAFNLHG